MLAASNDDCLMRTVSYPGKAGLVLEEFISDILRIAVS